MRIHTISYRDSPNNQRSLRKSTESPEYSNRPKAWWKHHLVLRHFIAALYGSEAWQYTAFLLLWFALQTGQNILRITSFCLGLLFVIADLQELAISNLQLIQRLGFYSALGYAVTSLLLLLLTPASQLIKSLQEYKQRHKNILQKMIQSGAEDTLSRWHFQAIHNMLHLHFSLWLNIPLRSIIYLLDLGFSLVVGGLLFVLSRIGDLSILS